MRINNPDYIFWKDIDIWIRPNVYGDVTDQVNKYAILNSIYNILSTEQGTRRMRPEFAINLKHLLFEPIEPLIIPDKSKLLLMLPKLRTASKIVTEQEIFTYFAMVHKIPCLAWYSAWNPNYYKQFSWITIMPNTVKKEVMIKKFLNP